jgi:hypothetical protein
MIMKNVTRILFDESFFSSWKLVIFSFFWHTDWLKIKYDYGAF